MIYLNLFYIYSILGHLLEKICYPDKISGILYGFWTPIYGFGSLFIILVFNYINSKFKLNKIIKFIITFLIGAIFLSFIEYIGGITIEKIFGFSFWDYSDMEYNIGKYASAEMSLLWGLCSLALIYILNPFIEKIARKIPKFITIIVSILFLIDVLLVFLPKV